MDVKVDDNSKEDFGNIDLAAGNTKKNAAASFMENLIQLGTKQK